MSINTTLRPYASTIRRRGNDHLPDRKHASKSSSNFSRNVDFAEESRNKLNLSDQMEIENGAGIGNDDTLHRQSCSRLALSRAKSCASYSIQT